MSIFYQDDYITVNLEDLGDTWQLDGIVIGNGQQNLILQMPAGSIDCSNVSIFDPTVEELEAWMKQTDDPIAPLYQNQDSKVVKAIVRKVTRQLDQAVVWKCYQRDNYTCVYCSTTGVPLTYDHYLAQAYGGPTTLENGRTSCRKCNKLKGHLTIKEWKELAKKKGLYDGESLVFP